MTARILEAVRRHALVSLVLVAALGAGAAYGAGKIGSSEIRANAVKARQLAPGAPTEKHGVILSKRVDIRDPHANTTDYTARRLFRYGPFRLKGECLDNGAGYYNKVSVRSSTKAYAIGQAETTDPDIIGNTYEPLGGGGGAAGAATTSGLTVATRKGAYMSVQIFAVAKATGGQRDGSPDCSFWVQGIGKR